MGGSSIIIRRSLIRLCSSIGMATLVLLNAHSGAAYPLPCQGAAAQADIQVALKRIRAAVDPCGDSPVIAALLDKVERCAATSYRICTDLTSDRNWFDRPNGDPKLIRTITWNPGLVTPIEFGCAGDPNRPVLRDATASLLHELTHAAQDCDGLDPTANEFEAVRIENIYRRAAGLCQRTAYGTDPLPLDMIRNCAPGKCPCTTPAMQRPGPGLGPNPPSAAAGVSADAQPVSAAP